MLKTELPGKKKRSPKLLILLMSIGTTVYPGAQHQDPDFTLAADLCYYLSFPGVMNVSLCVAVM